MPSTYDSKRYALRLWFEPELDPYPVIRAYRLERSENGDYDPDTTDVADRYDYTAKECKWVLDNIKTPDGGSYTNIEDYYADEWFYSDESKDKLKTFLPPKAIKWIKKELEVYPMTDYTSDTLEDQ